MFKRLMMCLLAASLLMAWVVVPDADARPRRQWGSILHKHNIAVDCPDYADDVYSVSDQLYGVAWVDSAWVATCRLTGLVYCKSLDPGDCPLVEANQAIGAGDFLATELAVGNSATTETALDPVVGKQICEDAGALVDEIWTFDTFWPVPLDNPDDPAFVAHTIYYDINGDILCEAKELCYKPDAPDENGDFIAVCSDYAGKFPCCGDSNELTVSVTPVEVGRVTSDPAGIDCDGTAGPGCEEEYNGTAPVYDTCPDVLLRATGIEPGWALDLWERIPERIPPDGGDCDGSTDSTCTTTTEDSPTVTARFIDTWFKVRVIVNGDDSKDKAYLWKPRTSFDDPEVTFCTGPEPCTKRFAPDTYVVVKRKGGKPDPDNAWGGICSGVPNSADTCGFNVPNEYCDQETRICEVVVNFVNK